MSTANIATVTKMLESLPDSTQVQAIEHLREYLADITDEIRWDESFKRTEKRLAEVGRQARADYLAGKTKPMDFDRL